jgi:hypothetical protein
LIPTRLKRYLLEPWGAIVRDRYEFLVHRHLRDGLEAGDRYCRDNARFRGENRFRRGTGREHGLGKAGAQQRAGAERALFDPLFGTWSSAGTSIRCCCSPTSAMATR